MMATYYYSIAAINNPPHKDRIWMVIDLTPDRILSAKTG